MNGGCTGSALGARLLDWCVGEVWVSMETGRRRGGALPTFTQRSTAELQGSRTGCCCGLSQQSLKAGEGGCLFLRSGPLQARTTSETSPFFLPASLGWAATLWVACHTSGST